MRRALLLAGLGILAFFSFLVLNAPAGLLLHFVPDEEDIRLQAVSGTLWEGRIGRLQLGPVRAGPVDWTLRPSRLLMGRADLDFHVRLDEGRIEGRLLARPDGRLRIPEARGQQIPLPLLAPVFNQPADRLGGEAAFQLQDFVVVDGMPLAGRAELRVFDLEIRAMGEHRLGAFAGELAGEDGQFQLNFRDAGDTGPFDLEASLDVDGAERRYALDGRIRAREEAPENLAGLLGYLGEADPEGYYPLRDRGRLR